MADHWTNKYAIWRDLSLAQGREVPVEIDNTVTVAQDERPPPMPIVEDTEEEFYANYVGGGDNNCGPDLDLISKMLKEVSRSTDETPTEDPPSVYPVINTTMSMFKRKEKKKSRDLENCPPSTPKPTSDPETEQPRMFVPSERALCYYNKYHEQSKTLQLREESVWSRAEREMKELDKRRKLNAILAMGSEPGSSNPGANGMDLVRLPVHRHLYTDASDCLVCEVFCKNKYYFKPTDFRDLI